jgi:hypothetical protein
MNFAKGAIIRQQAGLQGGQHDHDGSDGQTDGKMAVGKESLQDFERPDSDSILFRGFHLIWWIDVANFNGLTREISGSHSLRKQATSFFQRKRPWHPPKRQDR